MPGYGNWKILPLSNQHRELLASPGITDKDLTARGVKGQGAEGLAWASSGWLYIDVLCAEGVSQRGHSPADTQPPVCMQL